DGSSVSEEIRSDRLTSEECLRFLIELEKKYPSHIKVGFGISYDVNMIIRDIPEYRLRRLMEVRWTSWKSYKLQWISGKWFTIRERDTTIVVYDVCSFFGGSGRKGFEPAVESYLELTDAERVELSRGKAMRGKFTFDDLNTGLIQSYMRLEMDLLVRLMTLLR